jgi:hypothetical protein
LTLDFQIGSGNSAGRARKNFEKNESS